MTDHREFRPRPPSVRSQVGIAVAAHTLRPIASALPANAFGIAFTRGVLAAGLHLLGSRVRDVDVVPVDTEFDDRGRVRGEWIRPRGAGSDEPRPDAAAILYIHGSAYVGCSVATHRGLVARIARQSGLDVFSVEYRLAPRHRFPRAIDDVARAFDWLIAQGHVPERIVVMGDSAGGHLAVDLALQRIRDSRTGPAALVVFSPLHDHTFALSARREQGRPDPLVTAAAAKRLIDRYAVGVDVAHPRLAHVIAPHETLPPTLIQAGGAEMLAADAHALWRSLRSSGTPVRLEVWPGQLHVFQALPRLAPEAGPALRRATDFVRQVLVHSSLPIVEGASA